MTPSYASALVQRYMRSSVTTDAEADSSESPFSSRGRSRSPSVSPQVAKPAASLAGAQRNSQFAQRASSIVQAAAYSSDDDSEAAGRAHSQPAAARRSARPQHTGDTASNRDCHGQSRLPEHTGQEKLGGMPGHKFPADARLAGSAAAAAHTGAAGAIMGRRVSSPPASVLLAAAGGRASTASSSASMRQPARSLALHDVPNSWQHAPLSRSSRATANFDNATHQHTQQQLPNAAVLQQQDPHRQQGHGSNKTQQFPAGAAVLRPQEQLQLHISDVAHRTSSSSSRSRVLSPTPPAQQPPPLAALSPRSSAMLVMQQRLQQQQRRTRESSHDPQQQQLGLLGPGSLRGDDVVAQQLRDITQSAAAAIARARGASATAASALQHAAAVPGSSRSSAAADSYAGAAAHESYGSPAREQHWRTGSATYSRPSSPSLPPPNAALAKEAARRLSSPTPGTLRSLASPSPASNTQAGDSDSDDDALRALPGYGDGSRASHQPRQQQQQQHGQQQYPHEVIQFELQEGLQGLMGEHTGLDAAWEASSASMAAAAGQAGDAGSSWQHSARRLSATGEATAAALAAATATARRRSSMHEGAPSPTELAAAAVSHRASAALAAAAATAQAAAGAFRVSTLQEPAGIAAGVADAVGSGGRSSSSGAGDGHSSDSGGRDGAQGRHKPGTTHSSR